MFDSHHINVRSAAHKRKRKLYWDFSAFSRFYITLFEREMNTKLIDDPTHVSSLKLLGECSINSLKTKINPAYIKQSDYIAQ